MGTNKANLDLSRDFSDNPRVYERSKYQRREDNIVENTFYYHLYKMSKNGFKRFRARKRQITSRYVCSTTMMKIFSNKKKQIRIKCLIAILRLRRTSKKMG